MPDFLTALPFAKLISSLFLSILFLQSGLDKIFDWKGNLGWLQSHFAKSPLKNMVPMMLGTVTVVELAAGLTSALGLLSLLFTDSGTLALLGTQLSALSLVMLFFGQRIAKDYAGAATLVGYFVLTVLSMLLYAAPFE